jgi:hypothetical protein
MEQLVEWGLAGDTEVLGENLPQCHFVHHKSHMTWLGIEPGPPRWDSFLSSLGYNGSLVIWTVVFTNLHLCLINNPNPRLTQSPQTEQHAYNRRDCSWSSKGQSSIPPALLTYCSGPFTTSLYIQCDLRRTRLYGGRMLGNCTIFSIPPRSTT